MSDTILGFNRSNVLTVAGLAGAALVGYCIYFDHRRRTAPDYKQKIREKRREQARSRGAAGGSGLDMGMGAGGIPDPSDAASMQAYFLQEVQLGEEMMAQGNLEQGAVHIANAVTLCGQSQQLLQIFQQTLPPEQFEMVLEKLPGTRERLANIFGAVAEAAENGPIIEHIGPDDDIPPQIQQMIDDTDDLE